VSFVLIRADQKTFKKRYNQSEIDTFMKLYYKMENKLSEKLIRQAITEKRTLQIKYGLGQNITIQLNPYIFGSDMMQYDFVWGFIYSPQRHFLQAFDASHSVMFCYKQAL
jgi:hypothetical protein